MKKALANNDGDAFMTEVWRRMKRQHVIDCLARDEHPFDGWDKRYPDLAAQRLEEVKRGEHQ